MLYHFCKYYENKHSGNKKGYLAYQKLCCMNTKTQKLYDKFEYAYDINVGTDLPRCAETPYPMVKGANCNRIPIQN